MNETVEAELSESLPDEDEKNDNLLNEANTEKLAVRNIISCINSIHKRIPQFSHV